MTHTDGALPRDGLIGQLRHYFEAYRMLTEQIRKALEQQDASLLERMVDLRGKTIQQIDAFENAHPDLLAVPFDRERDPAIRKLWEEIRALATECQTMDSGLAEGVAAFRADLKAQADGLAKGQRGLKGYAQNTPDRARFVEAAK